VSKISKGGKIGRSLTENTHEISSRKFRPNLPLFFVGVPNKEELLEKEREGAHFPSKPTVFQFALELFFEWNSLKFYLRSITFV